MNKIAQSTAVHRDNLQTFYTRYTAVLEAVSRRVHVLVSRGQRYVATEEVAIWVANDLPTLYRQTFGRTPKPLKVWRIKNMLANANYLGAYEHMDIRSVRGRGITTVKASRQALHVISGGRLA